MVLINELTVEQINAALLHLQRSKDETVGGEKGTTIQNISISNSGGGGGNNVDYSGTIKNLATNIEKNKTAIEKNASDIAKLKSDFSNIEKSVEDTLEGLVDNGISDLSFDPLTKQLTITTNDGDTFQTTVTQDIGVLSYDSATNKLVLTTGEQTQEITLPYIKSSEKGSANGVATLDENGRVPYSQLPESAMEFLGQWDASTNTPHLEDGTGTNGDFYIVSAGGTVNLGTAQDPHIITFSVNDRIVYEGDIAQWVRLPAGQVSSVNGQSGEVTLTANDIEYSTGVSIKAKIDANAVQADWNVSDTTSLAYIKNKPTIPASPVQSDWNVTDTTSLAYIKNKPATNLVCTCKYTSPYDFDVVLTNTCDSQTQYTWVSAICRLRFCSSTGVLKAETFCGNLSGTATASNYLSTYAANGSDNITALKAVFDTAPKSVGTAVRLQHVTHSMAFGWFLNGYACANAYGGWFVSDYNIPKFVGVYNGTWTECTFITSENIGSQHVACADHATSADVTSASSADAVYYSALLDTSDKSYPLVFSASNVTCGYVSLKGNITAYFCCCYTCPTKSHYHFHAQIAPLWRLLATPTFTCNQGSDKGTNWFLGCACIDDAHQRGQVEVWNCTSLSASTDKVFSITLPNQLCPIKSAIFTYMYDCDGTLGGPELSAYIAGTCKICFGVYNRNSSTKLCKPHFLLQWWY